MKKTIIDCYDQTGKKVAEILPETLNWRKLRDALLAQEYQGRTIKKRLVEEEDKP